MEQRGSKISNVEWGLVFGATLVIDAVQFILDAFVVGAIINRFIDIVVGMALPLYFYLRGVKTDAKKVLTWIASFALEEVPLVDALPLWSGDVATTMMWDKIDKKLAKTPVLGNAFERAERNMAKVPTPTTALEFPKTHNSRPDSLNKKAA